MRALHLGLRAIMTLCLTGLSFSGSHARASFSTPYINTFNTADKTNDFVYGMSPGSKSNYITWAWAAGGYHYNYLNGSGAGSTLFGWATLDFSGLGGVQAPAHDFDMTAIVRAKHVVATTTNRPGGYQGFCALSTDTNLTDYYYGSFYFTNVVGTLQITKITGGVAGLTATQALTIAFDRDKYYGVRLQGVHQRRQLTLTLHVWDGPATNSVSLTDPSPLEGGYFGYRNCNNNGSTYFWWDNLVVTAQESGKGTIFILR